MFDRITQMLIKEFIQIFRDPRIRAVVLGMPLIQAIVFGYAINTDVRNVAMAVYDQDNSQASRQLIDAFVDSTYFTKVRSITSDAEIKGALDSGNVWLVLQIGRDFQSHLTKGTPADVMALIDGSDANTAGIISSYVAKVLAEFAKNETAQRHEKLHPALPKIAPISLETRTWFNENLVSRNFYMPGVIAILVTLATLTLTSMSIVREKEIGTMEQILVTPITRFEFITGKMLPYIVIALINVVGILFISAFWFDVPIRGNLLLLFFATSLYVLTTLGTGLFISTISSTQQQAMLSAFMFYFPTTLLSGFVVPIANMPQVIQWAATLNPLNYFLIIIRGIFLKGIGLAVLWPQFLALASIGLVIFWLAVQRFHKTLS